MLEAEPLVILIWLGNLRGLGPLSEPHLSESKGNDLTNYCLQTCQPAAPP